MFATKCCNAWLNTTRTKCNQEQSKNCENSGKFKFLHDSRKLKIFKFKPCRQIPAFNCSNCNCRTSDCINDRQIKNCLKFAPPAVSDNGTKNAEKVHETIESVIKNRRRVVIVEKFACQIKNQNCFHSIEIETFTEFIAYNKWNSSRIFQLFLVTFCVIILSCHFIGI